MGRVLLIEDDAEISEAVCGLLQDEGYGVDAVPHGQAAIEYLRTHDEPCLVLLDMMMPVMNGWELLTVLRQSGRLPTLPVVVVSAVAQQEPDGTVGLVPKPIDPDRLLQKVAAHCQPLH